MRHIITIITLTFVLSSCSFHTEISYRANKKDKYMREDGFMINCEKDYYSYGTILAVGTYTPDSWGEDFYYGYLKGIKSDKKFKITSVDVFCLETLDTLVLREIQKERDYIFTAKNLSKIIDSNKHVKIDIHLTDIPSGKKEIRSFNLEQKKHTYLTGTFPH